METKVSKLKLFLPSTIEENIVKRELSKKIGKDLTSFIKRDHNKFPYLEFKFDKKGLDEIHEYYDFIHLIKLMKWEFKLAWKKRRKNKLIRRENV